MNNNGLLPVIPAKDLAESALFYERVAGLSVLATDETRRLLGHAETRRPALFLIDEVSEFVPRGARGMAARVYLMLVVTDVDAAHASALALESEIVEAPHGDPDARRAILRDPNGVIVDVATPAAVASEKPLKHGA